MTHIRNSIYIENGNSPGFENADHEGNNCTLMIYLSEVFELITSMQIRVGIKMHIDLYQSRKGNGVLLRIKYSHVALLNLKSKTMTHPAIFHLKSYIACICM